MFHLDRVQRMACHDSTDTTKATAQEILYRARLLGHVSSKF
jgi:hypothetical protein